MNIYFVKNFETGEYFGGELEPYFERNWYKDYGEAKQMAWNLNRAHKKRLESKDKFVVEIKKMVNHIMYVKYGDLCYTRFFDVRDAMKFYMDNPDSCEIGYELNNGRRVILISQ